MHKITVLDSGLRVVTENMVNARTASLGIWIDVGSRDESSSNNGTSHFLEHMLFKGTSIRSALDISKDLDRFGGMSNAFTSKDTTCLYATVPADKLENLAVIFADMFNNSLFDQKEVSRESQVILQEIAMVDDMPDDQAYEQFEQCFWGKHNLSQTVLGSADVVSEMNTEKLFSHMYMFYDPRNVVVSCAGKVDHDSFVASLSELFSGFNNVNNQPARIAPAPSYQLEKRVVHKDLEQVHLLLGVKSMAVTDERRFGLVLLNTLLGGNMSSRLFQEVREKRGLAYSISTFVESYIDCGYFGVTAGVSPETVNETLAVINSQLSAVSDPANITPEEFEHAVDNAKASLFLSGENLEARMTRNARNEMFFGRNITVDEVVSNVEKVTIDEVAALASELFKDDICGLVMGDIKEKDVVWG